MKKFISLFFLFVMTVVSAVSFVSCSKDDDDDTQEPYLIYTCWLSDDAFVVADVVTDGVTLSFSPALCGGESGKQATVEFTGKQATDAHFTISLKPKSNLTELLATKDNVNLDYAEGVGHTKGASINLNTNVQTLGVNKNKVGADYETRVRELISRITLGSK